MDKEDEGARIGGAEMEQVFAFRWKKEFVDLWGNVAAQIIRRKYPTTTARDLLEEFISCFLSDEELEKHGLVAYRTYPPPRINLAMERSRRNRFRFVDGSPGHLHGQTKNTRGTNDTDPTHGGKLQDPSETPRKGSSAAESTPARAVGNSESGEV